MVYLKKLSDNGKLQMASEYRSPIDKICLAFPAGLIDEGEFVLDCAQRELEEEIGFTSNNIQNLFSVHSSVGFTDERVYVCVATDLIEGKTNFDNDEYIELSELSLDEAIKLVLNGEITSAPTVAGIWYLLAHREAYKL